MDKDEAVALFQQLAAAADADDDNGYDLDPEVESYDGHYYVAFRLKGRSAALEPDQARDFAESLLAAADEADAKLTDGP